MIGGTGADTFVFQATSDTGLTAATRDVINDFTTMAQSATAHDFIDFQIQLLQLKTLVSTDFPL